MTTRPKKTDLFAATTRQEKKTLIAVRYAAPTLHLIVDWLIEVNTFSCLMIGR